MAQIARGLASDDPTLAWRMRHHTLDQPPGTRAAIILAAYLFGAALLTAGTATNSVPLVAAGAIVAVAAAAAVRRARCGMTGHGSDGARGM